MEDSYQNNMSGTTITSTEFNGRNVTISAPKAVEIEKDGKRQAVGKKAFLNYNGEQLVLQSASEMLVPFGLNVFKAEGGGQDKYSINLSFKGYQQPGQVKAFYDALSALDEHMIDLGVKNSRLWFKSDMKREIVQAFYTPIVKFGRDKDGNQTPYPPNVKLQLRRTRDGSGFETEFYDEKSKTNPNAKPLKDVPVEEMLVKKVEVTALMQCTGVWFAGGKYGLSWKAVQVRLDSVPAGLRGNAFVDDEEFSERPREVEDEEEAPAQTYASTLARAPTVAAPAEEDDEEVAPAPVPKKMTVKKVLGKVKA
jgi:hypothetical protein